MSRITLFALSLATLFLCSLASAQEFSLKFNQDSSIYGPFEMKEGGKVEVDGTVFSIADIEKYGKSTFLLKQESTGSSYGPFTLRANSRISIGKASFTMLVAVESVAEKKGQGIPVKATKGKLESERLIKFEDLLDKAESGFTNAVRSRDSGIGTSGYEKLLTEFKIAARALQDEIVKAGLNDDFNVPKEGLMMIQAYEDAKVQYHGYEDSVPSIISTRRNKRLPGNQPTNGPSSSREDAYVEQDYSACKIMFDIDAYYVAAYKKFTSSRKSAKKGSQENLKNCFGDFVQSVRRLREMILSLEKTGSWNTISRNGQTYYMKSEGDAYK